MSKTTRMKALQTLTQKEHGKVPNNNGATQLDRDQQLQSSKLNDNSQNSLADKGGKIKYPESSKEECKILAGIPSGLKLGQKTALAVNEQ